MHMYILHVRMTVSFSKKVIMLQQCLHDAFLEFPKVSSQAPKENHSYYIAAFSDYGISRCYF